jgi:hypothetical protein
MSPGMSRPPCCHRRNQFTQPVWRGPGVELLALSDVLDEIKIGKLWFVNFDLEATW